MQTHAAVIDLARLKHQQLWTSTPDVSTQTRSSTQVCREWQQSVRDNYRDRFNPEHPVGPGMNEKIDLVDLQNRIAYELKVSQNNTHFEFYRDIFKVAVHNHLHPDQRLTKLVFITPEAGARQLSSKYAREVINLATGQAEQRVKPEIGIRVVHNFSGPRTWRGGTGRGAIDRCFAETGML